MRKTYQELFILFTGRLFVEFTSLNDFTVQLELLLRTFEDDLFDGAGRDQTQDSDLLLLTNTMRTATSADDLGLVSLQEGSDGRHDVPVLGLQICMRIPISIEAA